MPTIKINYAQNKAVFESILNLADFEDKNVQNVGGEKFYESLGSRDAGFSLNRAASSSSKMVFTSKGGEEVSYELAGANASGDKDENIGFEAGGARWFRNLREGKGKALESPDSDWALRRDRIAEAYHRKYFTVEYVVNQNLDERAGRKTCENFVKALGEIVFAESENASDFSLSDAGGDNFDTYYSAKLKINATLGVGQAIPLIGRVYYRDEVAPNGTKRYAMLRADQAKFVDDGLLNIPADGMTPSKKSRGGDSISETLRTQLEADLCGEAGSERLTECILFSAESMAVLLDHKNDASVDENGDRSTLSLECKSIELVSVSKIMWPNLRFSVMYGAKDVFELNYGIMGMSLKCTNCSEEAMLVSNDRFVFPAGSPFAGRFSIYTLDRAGLPDKSGGELESMKAALSRFMKAKTTANGKQIDVFSLAEISRHLSARPTCLESERAGNPCFGRRMCDCQIEEFEGLRLCKHCPKPENVYLSTSDAVGALSRYTPTRALHFDAGTGKMAAIPDDKDHRCSICGGLYEEGMGAVKGRKGLVCRTCWNALTEFKGRSDSERSLKEKSDKLFKKYKRILSPAQRLKALFSRCGCAENERYIIIRIGGGIYRFDKLSLNGKGYMSGAKKVKK